MFIVDDAVFSLECFEWFSERTGDVVKPSDDIEVFRFLLDKKFQSGVYKKQTYADLDAGLFWALVQEVFMLLSDIHKTARLPVTVSPSDLRKEMFKIEKAVVYWALRTNHPEGSFGSLDKDFITTDGVLNNKFCLYAYYIVSACRWAIDRLDRVIAGRDISSIGRGERTATGIISIKLNENNEFLGREAEQDKFIKDLVRIGYGGDFDEFIINVKEEIANQTIGPFHQKLALAVGYERMGISEFSPIFNTEVWRRLFTNYFDSDEDNYAVFYNTYTHQCLYFIFLDFLSLDKDDTGIDYLPVYKIFSMDKFSRTRGDNVKEMINTKLIRQQLYKLYKKKIK